MAINYKFLDIKVVLDREENVGCGYEGFTRVQLHYRLCDREPCVSELHFPFGKTEIICIREVLLRAM